MDVPTAKDVARRAGVSIATVSRVINRQGSVTPKIRRKVEKTVAALGYQPSRTAQRLRAKRSRVLGLIISDIENPFFTSVIRGIEDLAYQRGYSLVLCNSDEDPEKERLYINVMRAEAVAGVILASITLKNPHVHTLMNHGIPVVALDRRVQARRIDGVVVTNAQGVFEAVSHLIELGHQRIGFIGGPLSITTQAERREGYIRALREYNLPIGRRRMCLGNAKQSGGQACAQHLLGQAPRITALFVANNLMTLGALVAIRERGLRIPADISIVGFDDMPWVPLLQVPLTVVAQPTYEMGQKAAELLLERIEQPRKPVSTVELKTTLIIRQSSGAVPQNSA